MNNIKPRGFATKRPARTFDQLLHDHPVVFTIALIVAIGVLPALVEWLAS